MFIIDLIAKQLRTATKCVKRWKEREREGRAVERRSATGDTCPARTVYR